MRDLLIANSAAIVQDDSGIPLRFCDPKRWNLLPFGQYLGPIGVFPGRYQPAYAALFRNSRPIDFGIGYRWRPNESNLLLAIRKPESASEALVEPTLEKDRAETTQTVETNRNSTVRQRRAGYPQTFRWPLDWLRLSR
jgi:hypothetical protein